MRAFVAVLAFIFALAVVGSDDYADAKMAEKDLCRRNPKPEFCGREMK